MRKLLKALSSDISNGDIITIDGNLHLIKCIFPDGFMSVENECGEYLYKGGGVVKMRWLTFCKELNEIFRYD